MENAMATRPTRMSSALAISAFLSNFSKCIFKILNATFSLLNWLTILSFEKHLDQNSL